MSFPTYMLTIRGLAVCLDDDLDLDVVVHGILPSIRNQPGEKRATEQNRREHQPG